MLRVTPGLGASDVRDLRIVYYRGINDYQHYSEGSLL